MLGGGGHRPPAWHSLNRKTMHTSVVSRCTDVTVARCWGMMVPLLDGRREFYSNLSWLMLIIHSAKNITRFLPLRRDYPMYACVTRQLITRYYCACVILQVRRTVCLRRSQLVTRNSERTIALKVSRARRSSLVVGRHTTAPVTRQLVLWSRSYRTIIPRRFVAVGGCGEFGAGSSGSYQKYSKFTFSSFAS